MRVRDARLDDSEAINEIYNHYVPISNCTMETEPVSIETRRIWFLEHGERYPILVCEVDGQVVGWASSSPHRVRAAYRYTVEDAIYVREDLRGKGVGGALLDEMVLRCQALGVPLHRGGHKRLAGGQPGAACQPGVRGGGPPAPGRVQTGPVAGHQVHAAHHRFRIGADRPPWPHRPHGIQVCPCPAAPVPSSLP